MLPLPTPTHIDPKKGVERLREVLRLRDERDFVVIVAWLLAALAGRSPYAVIIFLGEPGATKTSAAYAVRSIADPNASPLRSKPKDPHEVFVAATHSLIVGYNNLSNLPDWLSDTICVVRRFGREPARIVHGRRRELDRRLRAVPAHRHRERDQARRPGAAHPLHPSRQRAGRRSHH
jgi:hypothetical protein